MTVMGRDTCKKRPSDSASIPITTFMWHCTNSIAATIITDIAIWSHRRQRYTCTVVIGRRGTQPMQVDVSAAQHT